MSDLPSSRHEQAWDLHRKYPVILIHDHEPLNDDLGKMKAAGICGKVMLPIVDAVLGQELSGDISPEGGWAAHANIEFQHVRKMIDDHSEIYTLAVSAQDFVNAHQSRGIAILLGSEGGKLLEGGLDQLRHFHESGMRWMQLNWAFDNEICGTQGIPPGVGLTQFGREVIREMNDLGILIDLEHSSRQGFWDALEISRHPIIFSHCGCRALEQYGASFWGCMLEDDDLRALARNGGLVGINFYPFVFRKTKDYTLDDVLDHFDHVVNLIGADHLVLGCDYFPDYGVWEKLQRDQGQTPIRFVVKKEELVLVTVKLLERGYSEENIAKILGGNFLRVCREVFGS